MLGDALGSVRQVVDDDRAHIVLTRSYSPFGKLLGEDGDVAASYGFAGEQVDPNGLVFLRARYYDVQTGRFISKDPFPGYAELPQSLHPYTYCFSNAINHTDPSGEIVLSSLLLAMGIGALVNLGVDYAITVLIEHQDYTWERAAIVAAIGALSGLTGVGIAAWIAQAEMSVIGAVVTRAAWNAFANVVWNSLERHLLHECTTESEIFWDAVFGGAASFAGDIMDRVVGNLPTRQIVPRELPNVRFPVRSTTRPIWRYGVGLQLFEHLPPGFTAKYAALSSLALSLSDADFLQMVWSWLNKLEQSVAYS